MKPVVAALVPALLVFVVAEILCRRLLHLSDGTVPLVVLPLSLLASYSTLALLRRRGFGRDLPPT